MPPDHLRVASDYPCGTVLRVYSDPVSGLRMLVVRGPFSFCSYVGVHADHALASLEELEFDCHFGINFRNWGQPGTLWEENWFWGGGITPILWMLSPGRSPYPIDRKSTRLNSSH